LVQIEIDPSPNFLTGFRKISPISPASHQRGNTEMTHFVELHRLDLLSQAYLYSCAGLSVDDTDLTIKNNTGDNVLLYHNNAFRTGTLFSFTKTMGMSNVRVQRGDVCPLCSYPNWLYQEWCTKMVNKAMQRFYHMVVYALYLDGKRGIVQIPGVNIGAFNDEQTQYFATEKLPLVYLDSSFNFIHNTTVLQTPYAKKHGNIFLSEICKVSEYLIGNMELTPPFTGKELSESHANRIVLNCQLAMGLQQYLKQYYKIDNRAAGFKNYLGKMDEYVKKADKWCFEILPQIDSSFDPMLWLNPNINTLEECKTCVRRLQEILHANYQSISEMINSTNDHVQASLFRFLRLSQDQLLRTFPSRPPYPGSNQIVAPPSPVRVTNDLPQGPIPPWSPQPSSASQLYPPHWLSAFSPLWASDLYTPQQQIFKNMPKVVHLNSQSIIPSFSYQTPLLKQRSERKIIDILNDLQDDDSDSNVNLMSLRDEQYERAILLLYRAEFELLKSVYDPAKSHKYHLNDLTIQVFQNYNFKTELSVKDFVNSHPSASKILIHSPSSNAITVNIAAVSQKLGFKQLLPILSIYSAIHGDKPILQCAFEIAHQENISTDLAALSNQSPVYESGNFSESLECFIETDSDCISFTGESNSLYYKVVTRNIKISNYSYFISLPLIYVSKTGQTYHKPFLLPPKKHRLFGLTDLLNYKDVPIFLTEHLEIAYRFSNIPDANFLSWWGNYHTLDSVDFSPLNGKTVYYVLFDPSLMRTALKACRKIKDVGGRPYIIYCERENASENDGACSNPYRKVANDDIYNEDHFRVLADYIGYSGDMFGFKDIPPPFEAEGKIDLVKGIFKTKEFIVVYGPEKSGKTYVSLSLALGIANKKAPHELWEINQEINAGVMYCHGEMTDSEIGERIKDIEIKMGIRKKTLNFKSLNLRDNFKELGKGVFDLTDTNCQEYLKEQIKEFRNKSKSINQMVIILDNYSCLMGTGSQQGDIFNSVYKFILNLQSEYECCVILVCHDNAEGHVASSRQIIRKVDGVIKVSAVAEWKEEIRKSFFSKVSVKNLIDFETIENELVNEFVEPKGFLKAHIDYQNFRHLGKLNPFAMTFRFDHEYSSPYAWEIEEADKEGYIKDLVALYSERHSARKNKDASKSDDGRKKARNKIRYDQLKAMNKEQIKEEIGKIGSEILSAYINKNISTANGVVPILKPLAKYYGVSAQTFTNLGKQKGLGKFTAKRLRQIIEEYQSKLTTESP
jgi:hypothetical protein